LPVLADDKDVSSFSASERSHAAIADQAIVTASAGNKGRCPYTIRLSAPWLPQSLSSRFPPATLSCPKPPSKWSTPLPPLLLSSVYLAAHGCLVRPTIHSVKNLGIGNGAELAT
jgi:hypothetical protein